MQCLHLSGALITALSGSSLCSVQINVFKAWIIFNLTVNNSNLICKHDDQVRSIHSTAERPCACLAPRLGPAHPRAHLRIFYANEQVQLVLEARGGSLGDEPDGAAQGAAGVQPEGFHQVMLSKPDWLRINGSIFKTWLEKAISLIICVFYPNLSRWVRSAVYTETHSCCSISCYKSLEWIFHMCSSALSAVKTLLNLGLFFFSLFSYILFESNWLS